MTRQTRRRLELAGGSAAVAFVLVVAISERRPIEDVLFLSVLLPLFGGAILGAYMWVSDRIWPHE